MPRIEAATDTEPYDEFGMLRENAEEIGLAWDGPPAVVALDAVVHFERLHVLDAPTAHLERLSVEPGGAR